MERNLLKKSTGFMLLCSVSLLMMFMTGCQEARLKATVKAANKLCPISMGESGKLTSITFDGSNVEYSVSLNEDIANVKALKDNPESTKASVKTMFLNPSGDIKQMLKLMINCNAGLRIIYIGDKSGERAVCELTAKELEEALDTNIDHAQSEQMKLDALLEAANLQYPAVVDEGMVVEKVQLIGESVVYMCTLDDDLYPISQIEENAAATKEGIMLSLAEQNDIAIQTVIKTCVNNNKSMTYRYISKKTGKYYDVVVTVPELKELVVDK